MSKKYSSGAQI